MSVHLDDTWDWLRASPLFLLVLTVGAYQLGCVLRDRTRGHPLAQPVLVAIVVVGAAISLLHVPYDTYRAGVEPIAFLLGPATVALAVPLYRQAHRLRGVLPGVLGAVTVGAVTTVVSGVLLVRLAGGSDVLARTAAPKSSTTPVAIALAERLGGVGPLAAVLAILAGILGAVLAPAVLTLIGVHDPRARGMAMGSVSHGIGTARMLHDDETQGAFSGLAMALTALAVSVVAPIAVALLL